MLLTLLSSPTPSRALSFFFIGFEGKGFPRPRPHAALSLSLSLSHSLSLSFFSLLSGMSRRTRRGGGGCERNEKQELQRKIFEEGEGE